MFIAPICGKVLRRLEASFQGGAANPAAPDAKYKQGKCPIMMRDWTANGRGEDGKRIEIDPQVAKNADAAPQTDVTGGRATICLYDDR